MRNSGICLSLSGSWHHREIARRKFCLFPCIAFQVMLRRVLRRGGAGIRLLVSMPRYSVGMAGGYGVGFVTAHRFVGLIQFSGMAAFTCLSGRRSACSPAVGAGKRNGCGVFGKCNGLRFAVGGVKKSCRFRGYGWANIDLMRRNEGFWV